VLNVRPAALCRENLAAARTATCCPTRTWHEGLSPVWGSPRRRRKRSNPDRSTVSEKTWQESYRNVTNRAWCQVIDITGVRCFDEPQPAVKTPNCHLTCEKSNENISTAGVLTFRLCTEYLSPVGFSFFNVALRRHRCRRSTMRHKTASV